MKLHLQQPLSYTHILENPKQCDQSFDMLLRKLEESPIGSDGCMVCSATMTDEICILNCHSVAFREPEETEPSLIAIPMGTYLFSQLTFPPQTGTALIPLLNRFVLSGDSQQEDEMQFFVRVYKERESDFAIQLIAAIQTTTE
ncbi:MAG: hypothetical protein CVV48_02515 [Spirochaetae bacterium HGW-Spirochaetae-4]|jgi:hypothetical protein|nr:MAG: hypothetical protein A2Y31_00575 [Spirochaetes bacterium GWC2_52_13]OHD66953.1 MAG: hypothetical protein A2101_02825 [Spirochaetes bacterium GWF2_52_7]PKL22512.1 MAG: hypothetical protein CVV48_02515 [Spirochaetae bacterium HGW-Spirochaetae-4]HCG64936.1 hypothetical protein [Sphaerochaeta sp.]HCS37940.1 hypothetical protein [Sphaerochaeta sp.]